MPPLAGGSIIIGTKKIIIIILFFIKNIEAQSGSIIISTDFFCTCIVACMHRLVMVLQSCTCLKDIDVDGSNILIYFVFYISHSANNFLNEFLKVVS